MSGPLLIVLHLIPQGILAGLFFVMGVQALEGNGITLKILFLAKDRNLTAGKEPLKRINRRAAIWWFVALELIGFGATFAITQTIAAVGFPIIILSLIPARAFLLPRYFTDEELAILDAPTASPFTMESVGGNYGQDTRATNLLPVSSTSHEHSAILNDVSTVTDGGNGIERGPRRNLKSRRPGHREDNRDSVELHAMELTRRKS
jgi:hypothetical protein